MLMMERRRGGRKNQSLFGVLILLHCLSISFSFISSLAVQRTRAPMGQIRSKEPTVEALSEAQVEEYNIEKGKRPWITRNGCVVQEEPKQEDLHTLISYNVLGPLHGEQRKHGYTLLKHRKWGHRKQILFRELQSYSADIYCLQEVTIQSVSDDWLPFFKGTGRHEGISGDWDHIYTQKILPEKLAKVPRRRRKSGHKFLGVATFYNKDKFAELGRKSFLLRDYIESLHSEGLDVKTKADTGAILLLQTRSTLKKFLLVNIHLFWEPSFPDVKAVQLHGVFLAIEDFLNEMHEIQILEPNECPEILLCGDFNSVSFVQQEWLPGNEAMRRERKTPKAQGRNIPQSNQDMSAVYCLLQTGTLDEAHPEHPDKLRSSDYPGMVKVGSLKGMKGLRNLYLEAGLGCHPSFTTKTDEFCQTIDYLWGTSSIQVDQLLQFPESEENFKPIPNTLWGSDHMALGMRFSL